MKKLLLIGQFFCVYLCGFGQNDLPEKKFIHQNSFNYQLGNSIKSIVQDHWGVLWIGTENGICRFDGYVFSSLYASENEIENSPTNNFVQKIFKDSQNQIWIATTKGVFVYNDSICSLSHLPVFENVSILTFQEDKNKNIWIGSDLGICILSADCSQKHLITSAECDKIAEKRVSYISKDSYGNIWAFSEYGLYKICVFENGKKVDSFDFSKKQTLKIENYPVKNSRIGFFFIDSYDQMWMAIDNKTYRMPVPDNNFNLSASYLLYPDVESLCIYQEREGNVWIGTRNQGILYLQLGQDGKICSKDRFWVNSLRVQDMSNTISALFKDNWGNFWVGTEDGLYVSRQENENKFYFLKENAGINSMSHNLISSIYEDSGGNMWFCTAYGLDKFDWVQKKTNSYTIKHYLDSRDKKEMVRNNRFQSMIEIQDGLFWLSTKDNFICFDSKSRHFYEDIRINQFLQKNNLNFVRSFFKDKKGNIWLAFAKGGLAVYVPAKDSFFLLETVDEELKNEDYWSVTEDARGYLWVGTRKNGLYKLKLNVDGFDSGENVISYKEHFLTNEWITSVYIDKDNIPWVGTSNKLFRYNPSGENFNQVQISSNSDEPVYVAGILEDFNDKLWVFSTNGIYRYDEYHNNTVEYYDINDRNLTRANYLFGRAIAADGTIFFGGINGIVYFFPGDIHIDTSLQKIHITDFRILNKQVIPKQGTFLTQNINLQKSITLTYSDYQFLFEFSTLYLTDPNKIKYAYKLDGFDKDWVYVDARRNYASYSNLSPGDYLLRIRSTNAFGVWQENEKVIRIRILPPLWTTWWAYCIYSIVALGLISFVFYVVYMRGVYKQHEKVNLWKNQLFRNIIQGFETPLFLLRAPLETLRSNLRILSQSEIDSMLMIMEQNIKRLSHRTKQLMDFQTIEQGQVSLSYAKLDLISFLQNSYDLFSGVAQTKNIRFEFLHSDASVLVYFDSEKMETIIFNLLSNAFKYTAETGLVEIRCYRNIENNQVWVEVQDTGIGIEKKLQEQIFQSFYHQNKELSSPGAVGTGLGLTLAKDYIELHQGKLFVESEPGEGSTFKFFIPAGKKSLPAASVHPVSSVQTKTFMEDYIDMEKVLDFAENESKTQSKSNSPTLFVVESKNDLSAFFEKAFKRQGYRVKLFDSTEQVILSSISLDPALILIDVEPGNPEALKVCKKIKDNIQISHIPVVLLVDDSLGEDRTKEGYEYGADACIAKRVEFSYLLIRIKHLIGLRNSIKEKLKIEEVIFPVAEKWSTTSMNEKFIKNILKVVEKNISDENFNLEEFARQMGVSRSVLNTRIQSLLGQTPIEFVKTVRLKRAAQLLESNAYSITEVSVKVGFLDLSYFSTCFKNQFGEKPSDYIKTHRNKSADNKFP